jgi:hypothetical protein
VKNLYINLFQEIDASDFSSVLDESIDNYYLDFQNKKNDSAILKNVIVEEIENFPIIYDQAVNNYTSFVAELSTISLENEHIRSFTFNDFPLFWLTGISEKHYYHWLMKAMLLNEVLKKSPSIFKHYNQIVILIPERFIKAQSFIKKLIDGLQITIKFITINSNRQSNSQLSLYKNTIKTIVLFLKMPSPKQINKNYNTIYLLGPENKIYINNYFKNIEKITTIKKEYIAQIPINPWLNLNSKLSYPVPTLFWKAKPSIFSLLYNYLKLFKTLSHLNRIKTQQLQINGFTITNSLFIDEIKNTLITKNYALVMLEWLKNYTEKERDGLSFLYTDEFYTFGRILSFSLSKQDTFGVQHSMIPKNHSVYHISDIEIKNSSTDLNDGFPIPHKFIVWGEYFKQQFLSHNTLPENFVITAGNPSYIKKCTEQYTKEESDLFSVIYCLTTQEIFLKEMEIIKNTLDNFQDLKLEFRFHPAWKFDKTIVANCFRHLNVSFNDDKNIFSAFKKADLVLTSSHSGVWLDAIVAKTPVIRLTTFFHDDIEENNMMYNVCNTTEMKNSLGSVLTTNANHMDNNFLYLKSDEWKRIFTDKKL